MELSALILATHYMEAAELTYTTFLIMQIVTEIDCFTTGK